LVKPTISGHRFQALDEGLVGMAVGGVRRVQASDFLKMEYSWDINAMV